MRASNESSRTVKRIFDCVMGCRWDELEALHRPDFWCEDRRVGLGGRTTLRGQLANLRAIRSLGPFRVEEECVETVGDSLSLCRYLFGSCGGAPGFEVEFLSVNEVDDSGLMASYIVFDPWDMEAASAELQRRSGC